MYNGSMGEPDGYVRLPDPTPVLPAKETVADAIFEVLKASASTYLTTEIGTRLNMGYYRLPYDYTLAVVKWMEARYFAGGLEAITERLDRIEGKLDMALVYEYDADADELSDDGDDDDGSDDEPRDVPHLDYDGNPL